MHLTARAARADPAARRIAQDARRPPRAAREGLSRGREALLCRRLRQGLKAHACPPPHAPPLTRMAIIGVTGRMGQAVLRAARRLPAAAHYRRARLGGEPRARPRRGRAHRRRSRQPRGDERPGGSARTGGRGARLQHRRGGGAPTCTPAARPASRCCSAPPAMARCSGRRSTTAARDIALLVAPNTSVAVALLLELTRRAAAVLPASFDIDVARAAPPHQARCALGHRTRTRTGGSAGSPGAVHTPAPAAGALRQEGEIGIASVRAGDAVGEHTVLFCGLRRAARPSPTGPAIARSSPAGRLPAALWLASQPAGRYGMSEFLGLKTRT